MGDITDKMNIVTDISMTLTRLYAEWRPMEHINAYEQIANKAIEISHLIDMIRVTYKRTPKTMHVVPTYLATAVGFAIVNIMIALKIFITIGILIISQFEVALPQHQYYYVYDLMTPRDKQKLVTLCHELVSEAKHKIHQTDRLRDSMSSKMGFQIGMIMGQIREKYKTMLELYRQMQNKHTNKSKLILPKVPERRPVHYFWRMEYIAALEIDIDRLIHILEQVPPEYLEDSKDTQANTEEDKTKSIKLLRNGPTSEEMHALLNRKEQEVKRNYRQQFLRQKLGLSANASMSNYPHLDNQ